MMMLGKYNRKILLLLLLGVSILLLPSSEIFFFAEIYALCFTMEILVFMMLILNLYNECKDWRNNPCTNDFNNAFDNLGTRMVKALILSR